LNQEQRAVRAVGRYSQKKGKSIAIGAVVELNLAGLKLEIE
jgi:hypothetical protein